MRWWRLPSAECVAACARPGTCVVTGAWLLYRPAARWRLAVALTLALRRAALPALQVCWGAVMSHHVMTAEGFGGAPGKPAAAPPGSRGSSAPPAGAPPPVSEQPTDGAAGGIQGALPAAELESLLDRLVVEDDQDIRIVPPPQ
jgi:hypothetical protein